MVGQVRGREFELLVTAVMSNRRSCDVSLESMVRNENGVKSRKHLKSRELLPRDRVKIVT